MRCIDCPDLPNGTRKRLICCRREGASGGVVKGGSYTIGDRVCELKVGDVVPMPSRKLDVRPEFTGESRASFKAARGPKKLGR